MHNNLLRKTTLKEVAAHAGVSLATVDRVISKRAPVSKRTEEGRWHPCHEILKYPEVRSLLQQKA